MEKTEEVRVEPLTEGIGMYVLGLSTLNRTEEKKGIGLREGYKSATGS